jgi:integrase
MASIKRRSDGLYRARYRDNAGKEHAKHFAKRYGEGGAQEWLDEKTAALVRRDWVDPKRGKQTVGVFGESWLRGRVNLKPKTEAGYKSLWETRIEPTWGNVPLSSVTHGNVAEWVADMSRDGLSASRVRQSYHLLSAMLSDAVKDQRLASNPATGLKLPRMPRTEDRYLTHDELDQLAEACGRYETFVLVLGYCGLRFGEAVALRVGRIDLLRGRLRIAEAITEIGGKAIPGTPKTHQQRTVPVPAFLCDEVARACEGKGRDDFVFTAPRGGVVRVGPFRRDVWNTACATVGLGTFARTPKGDRYSGLVPHQLRHAAASFAIASGASVKAVQAMLGHESATQTLDRYASLWPDELTAVADRISADRTASLEISRTRRGLAVIVGGAHDASHAL